jgi:periplasmic divalent cation tolerance protein
MGEEAIARYSSPECKKKKSETNLKRMRQKENSMAVGRHNRIVLVTCSSPSEAQKVANAVVTKRLAACVNILPGRIQSIYRWKGKVENAREALILIKTTARRLRELEREVKRLHSYDVPEFVAIAIVTGSREYLRWLADSTEP